MEETRTQQIMREVRDEDNKAETEAINKSALINADLKDLNANIELDAKEFGEHVRNGGWRLGLLVARNVKNDLGSPWEDEGISKATWYRRQSETISENSGIVSKIFAASFARQAGNITDKTVTKYLDAWNMAAADGHVLTSSELVPGQEVDFTLTDDDGKLILSPKLWDSYFKPPAGGNEINPEKFFAPLGKYDENSVREWMQAKHYGIESGVDHHKVFENLLTAHETTGLAIRLYRELAKEMDWTVEETEE